MFRPGFKQGSFSTKIVIALPSKLSRSNLEYPISRANFIDQLILKYSLKFLTNKFHMSFSVKQCNRGREKAGLYGVESGLIKRKK